HSTPTSPRPAPPFPTRRSSDLDAIGGIAGRLRGVLIHAPDIAEKLDVNPRGLARLHDGDVGSGGVAEIGVVGAGALQAQALGTRSEEHTSELQSLAYLVCRLLL